MLLFTEHYSDLSLAAQVLNDKKRDNERYIASILTVASVYCWFMAK